jgi:hypothetical protein
LRWGNDDKNNGTKEEKLEKVRPSFHVTLQHNESFSSTEWEKEAKALNFSQDWRTIITKYQEQGAKEEDQKGRV